MLSISTTNMGAGFAITGTSSQERIDTSIERLSTGKRINAAKDDAAGLSISTRLTTEIMGLNQATRNAADAQGLLDTAEGALKEVETHLLRIRELTVQSQNGTLSNTDKAALNDEVQQRIAAIDAIASNTSYGGLSLLDGSFKNKSLQIGVSSADVLNATINGATSSDFDIKSFSLTADKHTVTATSVVDTYVPTGLTFRRSDNETLIYQFSIETKDFSENGYDYSPNPYLRADIYNSRENSFGVEFFELSRNPNWDSQVGSEFWPDQGIEDARLLSNNKLAILKHNPTMSEYQILIIDMAKGQIEFPSQEQALQSIEFVTNYPDDTFHYPDYAQIIDMEDSGFAVVWTAVPTTHIYFADNTAVFLQKFDHQGNKIGEVQALSNANGTKKIITGNNPTPMRGGSKNWSYIGDGRVAGLLKSTENELILTVLDTNNNSIIKEDLIQITSSYSNLLNTGEIFRTKKGFGILWRVYDVVAGFNTYFQQFDTNGNSLSAKYEIETNGNYIDALLSTSRNGDEFLDITSQSYSDRYFQRFDLEGKALTDIISIEKHSEIHSIDNGDVLIYENHINMRLPNGNVVGSVKKLDLTENTTATIDSALIKLNEDRAALGVLSARLDTTLAVNINTSINLANANSLIKDVNYAQETADLAKNQILQQASIQMQVLRNREGDRMLELLSSSGFL